jgi:hypothetical protein
MKNIKQESLSVAEANQTLGVDLSSGMWEFIVRMINYPELTFDPAAGVICFMGYVPFQALAEEWVTGINEGRYDVRNCERCGGYFDVNTTDGIYGKPDEFEEFICYPCAEVMTAREYYERFIVR